MVKQVALLLSVLATSAVAQTSVSLVAAPSGTAAAGQVAGYTLNGVYSSDGSMINFETTLTFPISLAVNGTVL